MSVLISLFTDEGRANGVAARLTLGVICEREDPRDALVGVTSFDDLPEGASTG